MFALALIAGAVPVSPATAWLSPIDYSDLTAPPIVFFDMHDGDFKLGSIDKGAITSSRSTTPKHRSSQATEHSTKIARSLSTSMSRANPTHQLSSCACRWDSFSRTVELSFQRLSWSSPRKMTCGRPTTLNGPLNICAGLLDP